MDFPVADVFRSTFGSRVDAAGTAALDCFDFAFVAVDAVAVPDVVVVVVVFAVILDAAAFGRTVAACFSVAPSVLLLLDGFVHCFMIRGVGCRMPPP